MDPSFREKKEEENKGQSQRQPRPQPPAPRFMSMVSLTVITEDWETLTALTSVSPMGTLGSATGIGEAEAKKHPSECLLRRMAG